MSTTLGLTLHFNSENELYLTQVLAKQYMGTVQGLQASCLGHTFSCHVQFEQALDCFGFLDALQSLGERKTA